ncbi:unnamed protein product [Brachionus calyciflorus]|uniref:Uncharacterized protein n=1 Tax=Brachionus calyciflorus TaxID=104777 RepID=A0A813SMD2_9BILA|nr:unnamed protein product [Brachionus calyciflorus]
MSFFVTLPSNSSMDLYPNNCLSEFAVQFTYKHSWSLEVGKLVIDLLNEIDYDSSSLLYHDGENIISFTHRLKGEIWNYYIKKEYNRRYDQSSPYQRGYGLGGIFRNIFRWVMPLVREHAFPIAKSVGKELFRTASNVAQDALNGNDPKESVIQRLKESIKNISDKFHQGEGLILKPGLSINRRKRKSVSKKKSKKLFLTPSTNTSIVLATIIYNADTVAPVNNFIHSLFSQVELSFNGQSLENSNNVYPYKAYLTDLLNYGQDSKNSYLQSQLFYKDDAIQMDNIKFLLTNAE